jgi:hypothetical protein
MLAKVSSWTKKLNNIDKSHIYNIEVYMAFTHTKKVDTESFIKARIRIRSQTSGSDQKGPDPTGSRSGSATLLTALV